MNNRETARRPFFWLFVIIKLLIRMILSVHSMLLSFRPLLALDFLNCNSGSSWNFITVFTVFILSVTQTAQCFTIEMF